MNNNTIVLLPDCIMITYWSCSGICDQGQASWGTGHAYWETETTDRSEFMPSPTLH